MQRDERIKTRALREVFKAEREKKDVEGLLDAGRLILRLARKIASDHLTAVPEVPEIEEARAWLEKHTPSLMYRVEVVEIHVVVRK